MKLESRKNVEGKIVSIVITNNIRYERIQKNKFGGLESKFIVEWRKCKTNHMVNASKFSKLEEAYKKVDQTIAKRPTGTMDAMKISSGTTMLFDFKKVNAESDKKKKIDERIKEHLKFGNILSAVKYYKEAAGVGLKEAKDYVDDINAVYQAEKRWENGMLPTYSNKENESKAIEYCNKYFGDLGTKAKFIARYKVLLKENKSSLYTVKSMKDETGWGLFETKVFFDTFIK